MAATATKKQFRVSGVITIKADGKTLVDRHHIVGDDIDDMLKDALVLLERTQRRYHPVLDENGKNAWVRELIVCISSKGMPEVCTTPFNGLVEAAYAMTRRSIIESVYPGIFPHNFEKSDHRAFERTLMRAQAFFGVFKGLGRNRRRRR